IWVDEIRQQFFLAGGLHRYEIWSQDKTLTIGAMAGQAALAINYLASARIPAEVQRWGECSNYLLSITARRRRQGSFSKLPHPGIAIGLEHFHLRRIENIRANAASGDGTQKRFGALRTRQQDREGFIAQTRCQGIP